MNEPTTSTAKKKKKSKKRKSASESVDGPPAERYVKNVAGLIPPEKLQELAKEAIYPVKMNQGHQKGVLHCRVCYYHLTSVDMANEHIVAERHRKAIQADHERVFLSNLPKPTACHLDYLDNLFEDVVKNTVLPDEVREQRLATVEALTELVEKNVSDVKLSLYGSLATGISDERSDVNINVRGQKSTMGKSLQNILITLAENSFFESIEERMATFPYLECRGKDGTTYRITVNNCNEVHTADLLEKYFVIDERARKLTVLLRKFAREAFLDSTEKGMLPANVFPILSVFYLQNCQFPILPNLQKIAQKASIPPPSEAIIKVKIDDRDLSYLSDLSLLPEYFRPRVNESNLGALWLGLLRFYMFDFKSTDFVVSITEWTPVRKFAKAWKMKKLAVEDPFYFKRNMCRTVSPTEKFDYITEQLQEAYHYFGVPQMAASETRAKGPLFTALKTMRNRDSRPVTMTPTFDLENGYQASIAKVEEDVKEEYREMMEKLAGTSNQLNSLALIHFAVQRTLTFLFEGADIRDLMGQLSTKSEKIKKITSIEHFMEFVNFFAHFVWHHCYSEYFMKGNYKPEFTAMRLVVSRGCRKGLRRASNFGEKKGQADEVQKTETLDVPSDSDDEDGDTLKEIRSGEHRDVMEAPNAVASALRRHEEVVDVPEAVDIALEQKEEVMDASDVVGATLQRHENVVDGPDVVNVALEQKEEVMNARDAVDVVLEQQEEVMDASDLVDATFRRHEEVVDGPDVVNVAFEQKEEVMDAPDAVDVVLKHNEEVGRADQEVESSAASDVIVDKDEVNVMLETDQAVLDGDNDTEECEEESPMEDSEEIALDVDGNVGDEEDANEEESHTEEETCEEESLMACIEEEPAGVPVDKQTEPVGEEPGAGVSESRDSEPPPSKKSGIARPVKDPYNFSMSTWSFAIAKKDSVMIVLDSDEPGYFRYDLIKGLTRGDLEFEFGPAMLRHTGEPVQMCASCGREGHLKDHCTEDEPDLSGEAVEPIASHYELLAKVITNLANEYKEKPRQRKVREASFRQVQDAIGDLYPEAQLTLFGSCVNGFCAESSDLDVCMTFPNHPNLRPKDDAQVSLLLVNVAKILRRGDFKEVCAIVNAKVPIVKFRCIHSNIEGDISLNNMLAMENTAMLSLYADLDPCVRPLGIALKALAKGCGIGDASRGSLSSYAYIILLIHYLQQVDVLPVLQQLYEEDEKPTNIIEGWDAWYQKDRDVIKRLWKGKRYGTLSHLWLGFFRYYIREFQRDTCVVTIRQKDRLFKVDKLWGSHFAIEDPFDLNHNLSGGLSRKMLCYILTVFHRTLLHHSRSPMTSIQDCHLQEHFFNTATLTNGNAVPRDRCCRTCGKVGHLAKDCTSRPTGRQEVPGPSKPQQQQQQGWPYPYLVPLDTESRGHPSYMLYMPPTVGQSPPVQTQATPAEGATAQTAQDMQQQPICVQPLVMQMDDMEVFIPVASHPSNEVMRQFATEHFHSAMRIQFSTLLENHLQLGIGEHGQATGNNYPSPRKQGMERGQPRRRAGDSSSSDVSATKSGPTMERGQQWRRGDSSGVNATKSGGARPAPRQYQNEAARNPFQTGASPRKAQNHSRTPPYVPRQTQPPGTTGQRPGGNGQENLSNHGNGGTKTRGKAKHPGNQRHNDRR